MGDLTASVDWDGLTGSGKLSKEAIDASGIFDLVRGFVDFQSVLANITGSKVGNDTCYGSESDAKLRRLAAALDQDLDQDRVGDAASSDEGIVSTITGPETAPASATFPNVCPVCPGCPPCPASTRANPAKVCKNSGTSNPGSWGLITCNDNVDMSAVKVKGVGGDASWPPNQKRGWSAATMRGPTDKVFKPHCTDSFDGQGLFGGPKRARSYGDWIAGYYHELNQTEYSNIVWSNGQLDRKSLASPRIPLCWTAMFKPRTESVVRILVRSRAPSPSPVLVVPRPPFPFFVAWSGGGHYSTPGGITGPAVQNLTSDGSSIALPIALAAHHLDLYFPTPGDPASVVQARSIEEAMIRRWCNEHNANHGANHGAIADA